MKIFNILPKGEWSKDKGQKSKDKGQRLTTLDLRPQALDHPKGGTETKLNLIINLTGSKNGSKNGSYKPTA